MIVQGRTFHFCILVLLSSFHLGCTHQQLRFNTVGHAKTVADIHTQQVLDNLAKFSANPNALPHFEIPNQGGAGVTDSVSGSSGASFNPQALVGWTLGFGGGRVSNESFTMTPINDPRKLELMRCAYQRAISGCCCNKGAAHCPNCDARFNNFYLGNSNPGQIGQVTPDGRPMFLLVDAVDPSGNVVHDESQNVQGQVVVLTTNSIGEKFYTYYDSGAVALSVEQTKQDESIARLKRLYVGDSLNNFTSRTGIVTVDCIDGSCWFKAGKKSLVPRECRNCGLVGKYCDNYVWVPECGRDQLTKLTLTILDIAINEPAKTGSKEVTVFLDADEALTTPENASFQVRANIGSNSRASDAAPGAKKGAIPERKLVVQLEQLKKSRDLAKAQFELQISNLNASIAKAKDKDDLLKALDAREPTKLSNMLRSMPAAPLEVQSTRSEITRQAEAASQAEQLLREIERTQSVIQSQIDDIRNTSIKLDTSVPSTNPEQARTIDPASGGVLQLEQRLRVLGN